jgi:hypothetical protein
MNIETANRLPGKVERVTVDSLVGAHLFELYDGLDGILAMLQQTIGLLDADEPDEARDVLHAVLVEMVSVFRPH